MHTDVPCARCTPFRCVPFSTYTFPLLSPDPPLPTNAAASFFFSAFAHCRRSWCPSLDPLAAHPAGHARSIQRSCLGHAIAAHVPLERRLLLCLAHQLCSTDEWDVEGGLVSIFFFALWALHYPPTRAGSHVHMHVGDTRVHYSCATPVETARLLAETIRGCGPSCVCVWCAGLCTVDVELHQFSLCDQLRRSLRLLTRFSLHRHLTHAWGRGTGRSSVGWTSPSFPFPFVSLGAVRVMYINRHDE